MAEDPKISNLKSQISNISSRLKEQGPTSGVSSLIEGSDAKPLDPEVLAAGVKENPPHPELAPPLKISEPKTAIPLGVQPLASTQQSAEVTPVPTMPSSKIVSIDELRGKDPDKDSIVGLHIVEVREDERAEEAA